MEATVFLEIKKTEEYDIFHTHELQPSGRRGGDLELQESLRITEGNMYCPILVDEATMQIIDGHRRWYNLRLLGLPVYYIFIESDHATKLMSTMNNTSKKWSTAKFIEHYGFSKKQYSELNEFLQLECANAQLITLFTEFGYQSLRKGVDLSALDYDMLDDLRKGTLYVHSIFSTSKTTAMRAIKKVSKSFDEFNVNALISEVDRLYKKGEYSKLSLVGIDSKITDVLIDAYKNLK